MKKQLVILFAISIGIINLYGCNSNAINKQLSILSNEIVSKQAYTVKDKNIQSDVSLNNEFFFQDLQPVHYKANFSFITDTPLPDKVELFINEVLRFKNGILYELKIAYDEDFSGRIYYDWDRFHLGYFYIQKDKILLLREPDILNKIKTEEDIILYSTVVCQNEELKDALKEEEKGFHQYILINGNKKEYHSYNNLVETGFYETFIWEKGVGLVSYRSGFGAEKDGIELHKADDTKYGE